MKTLINKFKFIKVPAMLLCAVAGINLSASAAQFVTNFPVATSTSFLIVSNQAPPNTQNNISRISQIQVIGGTAGVALVDVFDSNTNSTNYSFNTYTNTISYPTNITTTNISPLNGYTNYETNIGIFTTNQTVNGGTAALPYQEYPAAAGTVVTYPVNLIMTKGVVIRVNTNATVILTYKASVN